MTASGSCDRITSVVVSSVVRCRRRSGHSRSNSDWTRTAAAAAGGGVTRPSRTIVARARRSQSPSRAATPRQPGEPAFLLEPRANRRRGPARPLSKPCNFGIDLLRAPPSTCSRRAISSRTSAPATASRAVRCCPAERRPVDVRLRGPPPGPSRRRANSSIRRSSSRSTSASGTSNVPGRPSASAGRRALHARRALGLAPQVLFDARPERVQDSRIRRDPARTRRRAPGQSDASSPCTVTLYATDVPGQLLEA